MSVLLMCFYFNAILLIPYNSCSLPDMSEVSGPLIRVAHHTQP
jgi:hypothetical protein